MDRNGRPLEDKSSRGSNYFLLLQILDDGTARKLKEPQDFWKALGSSAPAIFPPVWGTELKPFKRRVNLHFTCPV